jgi:hypothetical protein
MNSIPVTLPGSIALMVSKYYLLKHSRRKIQEGSVPWAMVAKE